MRDQANAYYNSDARRIMDRVILSERHPVEAREVCLLKNGCKIEDGLEKNLKVEGRRKVSFFS